MTQLENFSAYLDTLLNEWEEEADSTPGYEFTPQALFYLNDYLNYTSIRTTYSDAIFTDMDLNNTIQDGILYIRSDNFGTILNQYGEYQVSSDIYKYISEYEIVTIKEASESLLDSVRNIGGYFLHPNLEYENLETGTVMKFQGQQSTQGVCQIVVQPKGDPVIMSTSPWIERREFECFVSTDGFLSNSLPDVTLSWNFGDNSPIEIDGVSGSNVTGYFNTKTHDYSPGQYNITVEASCDANLPQDCESVCDNFVQSGTLTITINEPDCKIASGSHAVAQTYSHNGKDYKLICDVYAQTFAHFRACMGTNTRFYKKKNGTFKPFKPDDRVEAAIESPVYHLFITTTGAFQTNFCQDPTSYNSYVHYKHANSMNEEWRTPAFGNDERFATQISNPSKIIGFSGVKHDGQYWYFSINKTIN
ncbi:MAG: hypothetical protein K1X92_12135 [Bacteroidia bacterium]|nr:hypothetical protein [Bacteroidia bacterium]